MKIYVTTLFTAAGLLVGCNQSIEKASANYNELPPAVQKTVRAQAPNGEIAKVDHKTENGVDLYEIEFREPGSNPKIVVASDGKLMTTDMPRPAGAVERMLTPTGAVGTKFSALPEKVQKTIQATSPNIEIADISRHEDNGRVIYEIEFKDKGKNPTMRIADDGTVVQQLQK
jgi:uncharacterized membrane protein YkoI